MGFPPCWEMMADEPFACGPFSLKYRRQQHFNRQATVCQTVVRCSGEGRSAINRLEARQAVIELPKVVHRT